MVLTYFRCPGSEWIFAGFCTEDSYLNGVCRLAALFTATSCPAFQSFKVEQLRCSTAKRSGLGEFVSVLPNNQATVIDSSGF